MFTIACNLLLSLMIYQAQFVELKIVDENNIPIEGVYVKQNNNFWYSNKDGIVKIDEKQINQSDSIYLSHLSYKPNSYLFKDLKKSDDYFTITLQSETKTLAEVTVLAVFNIAQYVEDAIKKIPSNYVDPYVPFLSLNADITFDRTDEEQELIRYKGILQLSSDKKEYYVNKEPEFEFVSPDLKKNIFFIKPYQALSIISVSTHHVIRRYKRYDFYKYEMIEYKDRDAMKIYFNEKGKNPFIGHLIIDRGTMAILSVNYSAEDAHTWTVGTMKGKGLVKTGIDRYYVEADYIQDVSGKYIFDSGRENIESTNRWKNNSVATSSNIYLKRNTDNAELQNEKKAVKEMF